MYLFNLSENILKVSVSWNGRVCHRWKSTVAIVHLVNLVNFVLRID